MKRIRELRKKANLTQSQLSKYLGIDTSAVSLWETGKSMPTADKLPDLAKILGCTIDELFEEE